MRVILTAPAGNFYGYILKGLAEGFSSIGIDAYWNNTDPDINFLLRAVQIYDPIFVLQINRVLPKEQEWPKKTMHVSWIQDYRFDGLDLTKDLGSGQIIYFLIHPSAFGISVLNNFFSSVLLPGVNLNIFSAPKAFLRDFSFVGFIAPCVDYNIQFQTDSGGFISLQDFLNHLPEDLFSQSSFCLPSIRSAIENTSHILNCTNLLQRNEIVGIFDEILPRSFDRRRLLDAVLKVSKKTEIYGHENWLQWDKYKFFYRGPIDDPKDCDQVFITSKINLHNSGLGMHFRVLDCMATGSFILVNETPYDKLEGGILNYLEPNIHYGSYNFENLENVAKQYLKDSKIRTSIGLAARNEVLNKHTWAHRAKQICNDLSIKFSAEFKGRSSFLKIST